MQNYYKSVYQLNKNIYRNLTMLGGMEDAVVNPDILNKDILKNIERIKKMQLDLINERDVLQNLIFKLKNEKKQFETVQQEQQEQQVKKSNESNIKLDDLKTEILKKQNEIDILINNEKELNTAISNKQKEIDSLRIKYVEQLTNINNKLIEIINMETLNNTMINESKTQDKETIITVNKFNVTNNDFQSLIKKINSVTIKSAGFINIKDADALKNKIISLEKSNKDLQLNKKTVQEIIQSKNQTVLLYGLYNILLIRATDKLGVFYTDIFVQDLREYNLI